MSTLFQVQYTCTERTTSSRSAAKDSLWRALLQHPNVFHEVRNVPQEVFQAWSNLSVPSSAWNRTLTFDPLPSHCLFSPEHVTKLKGMLYRRPISSPEPIIEWGKAVNDEERARHAVNLANSLTGRSAKKLHKKEIDKIMRNLSLNPDENNRTRLKQRLTEVQIEFQLAEAKLKNLCGDHFSSRPTFHGQYTPKFLSRSPLVSAQIGNSTSTKLNYILHDILSDDTHAKYLIFSKSPLTLAYISESLELVGIKSLQFTSKVNLKEREQAVVTFETSGTYRVFLMELKHGARGL